MEKAAIAMLTLLACILLPDTLGASLLSLQKDAERPSYINHTETVSCPSGAMVPLVVWVQPVSVTIGAVQQIKAIAVLNMKPACCKSGYICDNANCNCIGISSNGDVEYEPMLKLYPSTPKP